MWRYNLVWEKSRVSGFLNAKRMPLRCHEDICVFYNNLPVYNPQMRIGFPNHSRGNARKDSGNKCYGKYDGSVNTDIKTNEKFPISVIKIDKEHNGDTWHPTQKPVDLIRYLIRTYSNEGDVILDNCSGSGTTAVACVKEKRHFICFEKDETYWKKSVERVKNEQRQFLLF